jgi:ammonia channel protein AmtB
MVPAADAALGVIGVQGIGGIIGLVLSGACAPTWMGFSGDHDWLGQIAVQAGSMAVTVAISAVGIFLVVRVSADDEEGGLDCLPHGEVAYS